jgi:hypothetical protein
MKASATQNLGYCEMKQHKPWFMKSAQNYMKGSRVIAKVVESKSNKWK